MSRSQTEFLRPHLVHAGLSEAIVSRLEREWEGHEGAVSYFQFLVDRNVLTAGKPKILESIQKGYMSVPVATVLGTVTPPVYESSHELPPIGSSEDLTGGLFDSNDVTAPIEEEIPQALEQAPETRATSAARQAPIPLEDRTYQALPPRTATPRTDKVPPFRHPSSVENAAEPLSDILRRLPVPPTDRSFNARTSTPPKPNPRPMPQAPSLRFPKVGEQVGRYLLQERLGEGSTAIIFRSFHPALGVPVAVKVFRPETRGGDLFSEARILAKLDHPNIVRVLDVDESDGIPYIVFEYVGSMTLEDLVTASGRLPCDRVLELGVELASGLLAAHEQSLLHRDVKPSNVLIRKDGRAKLVDFGLATVKNHLQGPDGQTACGSPAYMAPEQILRPADVDHRTDMYGLGATLYHAAAGEPPISKPTPAETLKAQLNEVPLTLVNRIEGFDPAISRFMETLLRKRPDERLATWEVAIDQLLDLRTEWLSRHGSSTGTNKSAVRTIQRAWSSIWHRSA